MREAGGLTLYREKALTGAFGLVLNSFSRGYRKEGLSPLVDSLESPLEPIGASRKYIVGKKLKF